MLDEEPKPSPCSRLMHWPSHHRGLGALIAEKFAAEGCQVAINYVSDLESANVTAKKIDKAFKTKTIIIQGVSLPDPTLYSSRNAHVSYKDVGLRVDCERIVQESLDKLGGLDIIVSNAVGKSSLPLSEHSGMLLTVERSLLYNLILDRDGPRSRFSKISIPCRRRSGIRWKVPTA